ncbi:DNA fragmentation factor subunit beta isoform X2 [Brachyhypopomus gauderio]|uniref:DNA fragmentation factor subunit beta isoform X2 n=1 Tax=Brachyhypopomus gauderio TaxID=698409 RepID=UPI0040413A6F
MPKPKLFKIRRAEQAKKFGVAAFTLKELIRKGCDLFQLCENGATQCCLYEDGTILTKEYFRRLPDNTEVVLLSDGQSWNKLVYDLGQVLGIDRHADDLISAAQKLQEGIDTRFKTKSSYMKYNCEQRIRGYMKEVQGFAKTITDAKEKHEYDKIVASFAEKLKSARYHGTYFDRTEKEQNRLCTPEGWFSCQGAFDQDQCPLYHSINPYGNRENRILFSTWNLDHRIEKKRTIIPTLAAALTGNKSSDVNLDYFYNLLFTRVNLKLVHIVCHKKGAHDLTCDPKLVFKRVKKTRK